jgi:hypothetical protein
VNARTFLSHTLAITLLAASVACGGGGSASTPPTPPPPVLDVYLLSSATLAGKSPSLQVWINSSAHALTSGSAEMGVAAVTLAKGGTPKSVDGVPMLKPWSLGLASGLLAILVACGGRGGGATPPQQLDAYAMSTRTHSGKL